VSLFTVSIVSTLASKFVTPCMGDLGMAMVSSLSGMAAFIVMGLMRWSWMAWLFIGVGCFKVDSRIVQMTKRWAVCFSLVSHTELV
jgi:hypothetical protein